MEIDDIIEVEIESVAFEGKCIAKVDNFVIFFPFVLAKEIIKVKITKIKSSYAEAKLIEIIKPSPLRVTPECSYYESCGSCVYQHIPYEEQLKLKTKQLKELYRQFNGIQPEFPIKNTCPSPKPFNYRTKIRLKYKKIKKRFIFGYFDYYSNKLIDIEQCPIASSALNRYLAEVRDNNFEFFRKQRIKSFNLSFLEGDSGVISNLDKSIEINTKILNKNFIYNRDSFFQINHSIFPSLFEILTSMLKAENIQFNSLLDLYCGVGFFGIIFSDIFKKIQFIESNKISYQYLLKNIELNHINDKSQAIYGAADSAIKQILTSPEVVLMDPPRSGATPSLIQDVIKLTPEIIIYISCNPATQFRDTKLFETSGYKITSLQPFDFFPQTKHIETVALLKR